MKRFHTLAAILGIAVLLGGCGGRTVDEELLPTRVPLLNAADLAVTAIPTTAPTSTPIPAPDTPTPLPLIELATTEPQVEATVVPSASATEAIAPTAQAAGTVAPEETPTVEFTVVATEALTPTTQADSTVVPEQTPTVEPTAAATETLTATETAEPTVTSAATPATEPTAAAAASPTAEANLFVPTATAAPAVMPTPAPTASPTPVPADDQAESASVEEASPVLAGLPENMLAAMAAANPARGEQLTLTNGCIGCHSLNPNQVMAGPTWQNVGETAATRVVGQSPALYLYNSILHPNEFVVEGYMPNIMLQIYEQTLSDQDLADIVSYLLSQQGD